ncbi:MAG: exosortase-associated EpsI family protein [Chthoniobacterales bacterium]
MTAAFEIPWWRSVTLAALAAITVWLCRESSPPDIAPEAGIVMDLPTLVGEWWGTEEPVSPSELALLPGDTEFAKKIYQDLRGDTLTAQVVLSGGEKRSIHRPEICLPAQILVDFFGELRVAGQQGQLARRDRFFGSPPLADECGQVHDNAGFGGDVRRRAFATEPDGDRGQRGQRHAAPPRNLEGGGHCVVSFSGAMRLSSHPMPSIPPSATPKTRKPEA